jgi:hypothetical protein
MDVRLLVPGPPESVSPKPADIDCDKTKAEKEN